MTNHDIVATAKRCLELSALETVRPWTHFTPAPIGMRVNVYIAGCEVRMTYEQLDQVKQVCTATPLLAQSLLDARETLEKIYKLAAHEASEHAVTRIGKAVTMAREALAKMGVKP